MAIRTTNISILISSSEWTDLSKNNTIKNHMYFSIKREFIDVNWILIAESKRLSRRICVYNVLWINAVWYLLVT